MPEARRSQLALVACLAFGCASAPPVDETTIDLPAPLAVASSSSLSHVEPPKDVEPAELMAINETIVESEVVSTPTRLAPPLPPPFPPGLLPPGVLPPGLLPPPTGFPPPVQTSTAGPLGKQSEVKLTADLRKALLAEAPGSAPMTPNVGGVCTPAKGASLPAGVLVIPVMLEPAKCYTFVAVTRARVEVSIELLMELPSGFAMPMPLPPLAVAKAAGPTVSLGGGSSCFKMPLPLPMPARLVVGTTGDADVLVASVAK